MEITHTNFHDPRSNRSACTRANRHTHGQISLLTRLLAPFGRLQNRPSASKKKNLEKKIGGKIRDLSQFDKSKTTTRFLGPQSFWDSADFDRTLWSFNTRKVNDSSLPWVVRASRATLNGSSSQLRVSGDLHANLFDHLKRVRWFCFSAAQEIPLAFRW